LALQFSVAVRNAKLDAIETTLGVSAILRIRTGAAPASCADADAGTVLAELTLPVDWAAAASGGTKAKSGTGTAAHWRLYDSTGTVCHAQGTCTATGGGGDMELSSTSITTGDAVSVTAWTFTEGNA
jgi:hypothetical protein